MSLAPSGQQRAVGVTDADVVLCTGEQVRNTLETCSYWENYTSRRVTQTRQRVVQRTQTQVPISAVAASTGMPLAQGIVTGTLPHVCGQFSGSTPTPGDYEGASIGGDEVSEWLRTNNL